MTPSNGTPRYRVSFAGRHTDWLREQGLIPPVPDRVEFAQALDRIIGLLETRPLDWGDPLRDLRYMGLAMFRGQGEGFLVDYGVDNVRRIVYVASIRFAPWHPL